MTELQAVYMIEGQFKGMVGYILPLEDQSYQTYKRVFLLDPGTNTYRHSFEATVPDEYYVVIDDDLMTFGKFGPQDKEE